MRVGLVVPLSGPLGLTGPSCLSCAELARQEIDASDGIAGRPLELVVLDGGRPPVTVAGDVSTLVERRGVDAIVGMHTSSVRVAVVAALAGRVPYVYTPPYEGGERAEGVFHVGETPPEQLLPAARWLVTHRRARRWAIVGNDYVWPRRVGRLARAWLPDAGAEIVAEHYVPLGRGARGRLVDAVAAAHPDAVLLTLIGSDLVAFNRIFAELALGRRMVRLALALEENVLLGIGGDDSGELYSAMGYFDTLASEPGLAFLERYVHAFGPDAPVPTAHSQSCYEGLHLLAALARRARGIDLGSLASVADGTAYDGARGRRRLVAGHVRQPVYLGRADGLEFDVVASL